MGYTVTEQLTETGFVLVVIVAIFSYYLWLVMRPWNHQWAAQSTLAGTSNPQRKRKWSRRGHRCGVDQIPSDDQVRIVLNSRVLERVFFAYLDLREYSSFYSRRMSVFPPWIRSLFLVELFFLKSQTWWTNISL